MDERARKQLLVLIGPRGSGKTTLARMLEQRLGARFVRPDELASQDAELLVIESDTLLPLSALRDRYDVFFVRVHAQRETCDARVLSRGEAPAKPHDAWIDSFPWDLELDNDSGLDARSVADAVRPLIR